MTAAGVQTVPGPAEPAALTWAQGGNFGPSGAAARPVRVRTGSEVQHTVTASCTLWITETFKIVFLDFLFFVVSNRSSVYLQ